MAEKCLKCSAPAYLGLNTVHCSNPGCEDHSELAPTIPPPPPAECTQCYAFRWAGYESCRACGQVFTMVHRDMPRPVLNTPEYSAYIRSMANFCANRMYPIQDRHALWTMSVVHGVIDSDDALPIYWALQDEMRGLLDDFEQAVRKLADFDTAT